MRRRNVWILVGATLTLAVGAAVAGGVVLLVKAGRGRAFSGGSSYLAVSLRGSVPERPTSELDALFADPRPSLRGIIGVLDRGSRDPKIKSAVLEIGNLPDAGWGRVQELRDAVARFRGRGKKVIAYLDGAGNKEYYLAASADEIYAAPTALLDISGLAAEVIFFRGSLDKLGVEAQFEGFGKYKSAPNQFTEKGMTPAHREQMDALVDDLFAQFVEGIAVGRKLPTQRIAALIDAGPYDAKTAVSDGLLDGVLYRDEVASKLAPASRLSMSQYGRGSKGFSFATRPKVALVYVLGEIVDGDSEAGAFGGNSAGSRTIARAVRQARENSDVKAVVLRVDSPGGSGTASDEIWREVKLTVAQKPVIVSMGDVAASGGYYVAMAANAIIAEPSTITGSIGVFGGKFSLRGLYDKLGISQETLVRGAHADLFSAYRPWTDDERAKIREMLGSFYDEFLEKAAEGRSKTVEEIDAVAQGRVWTGSQAHEVGLVDRLGGLDAAIALARERAGLGGPDSVDILALPRSKGFFETMMERQQETIGIRLGNPELRSLMRLATAHPRELALARLPFELTVR